jgi:chaperonin GroEL
MKKKNIIFQEEAKDAILAGSYTLYKAVSSTLGPNGKNVIIEQENYYPLVTMDGVSVANEIVLENKPENMGCLLLRNAANKTLLEAGDGTTTTIIIAYSLMQKGYQKLKEGFSANHLKDSLELMSKEAISYLKSLSVSLDNNEEQFLDIIEGVATISSNNDSEIGTLLRNVVAKIGKSGNITHLPTRLPNTYVEYIPGISINSGFMSNYFILDEAKQQSSYDNCLLLISNYEVKSIEQIEILLTFASQNNKPIVILATSFEKEFIRNLAANVVKRKIIACCVKYDSSDSFWKDTVEDIALLTGATIVTGENNLTLETAMPNVLGNAVNITCKKNKTIITAPEGLNTEKVNALIAATKELESKENSLYQKERYQNRIYRLNGKNAIIHVGADTEVELQQKIGRVDDAVKAVKSAIEEGVNLGGGSDLYRTALHLEKIYGSNILSDSLKENYRLLKKYSSVESDFDFNVRELTFDFKNKTVVNGFENKIFDPTKVLTSSIKNAVSVANMFITTDTVITNIEELL